MSEYGQFMNESIATLDRILGKSSQGPEGSGPQGSNVNDLTNLFHFLLLDKVDVKPEIRDKLTKVYSIFRSNSISQPVPPQPGAPQPGPPQPATPQPAAPQSHLNLK